MLLTERKLRSDEAVFVESQERPRVRGKFLFVGEQKLYVRGVTYGTFRPRGNNCEFPLRTVVEKDFVRMAANGINSVRTYSMPPLWLLDAALRRGLRILVGLPMERYIGYLADNKSDTPDPTETVCEAVGACAGHPAVLGYSIGNEISASMARWHGRRKVERFLESLYRAVKGADPEALVTYANYPSTEYLRLPFLDFLCYNVYLETRGRFEPYLARLQSIAGDRPLVMGELGLDAYRNGEERQAFTLDWQIRTAFAAGCAGAFVYSWTDEWYRGGEEVTDWEFGLTRRNRRPKAALSSARRAFAESPFPPKLEWPRVSVVVCSYNGAATLDECLAALGRLDYPDYEVILVDDGSTDETAQIASRYCYRVITTPNRGLSSARNTGLAAATGSIIAYVDDDAYPDRDWLSYVALAFIESSHAAVGGPNLPPPGDGWIADCVANAPGNPTHVLLSDTVAEHLPGCNMAFRKAALDAVGGFDTRFRVAGDDVDLCWRLTDAGYTLGFSPAAVVWHHRRDSVRAFWRQQRGYGRAEGMLQRAWPGRHDESGHISWTGRIYGRGLVHALSWGRSRIYHGIWGAAPFQSIYEPAAGGWTALVQSPTWYMLTIGVGVLSLLGLEWAPLRFAVVPFLMAIGALFLQAGKSAAKAVFHPAPVGRFDKLRHRTVTAFLFLMQPMARLVGRLGYAVRSQRWLAGTRFHPLWPHSVATWTAQGQDSTTRLTTLEREIRTAGAPVSRGGDFDNWDLQVRWGSFGAARLRLGVEYHDLGHQLVRVRVWPKWPIRGPLLTLLLGALSFAAAGTGAWTTAMVLGVTSVFIGFRTVVDAMAALSVTHRALTHSGLDGS